jgi:hypothetical protein
MGIERSRRYGLVADEGSLARKSVEPSAETLLFRELRELLKGKLDGPEDSAVAISARPMTDIFRSVMPHGLIALDHARQFPSVRIGEYEAYPIFATTGYRHAYAGVFNRDDIERRFNDYFPAPVSRIRGGIGEAVRNVAQHGIANGPSCGVVKEGEAFFASAGLFVRELRIHGTARTPIRVLMALVSDEGKGIANPERSILDGVGNGAGEGCEGMGVELNASLIYIAKASTGEWSVFDGLHASIPTQYIPGTLFRRREVGPDERIDRVCAVDLPAPATGCQKIMFFSLPNATSEQDEEATRIILNALKQS